MISAKVGVLALQGAFREHRQALERLGHVAVEVRLPDQLDGLAGLIIPGGESTTMAKLMATYGFDRAIPAFHAAGGAVWGTCAGAIVVASEVVGYPDQPRLGLIDLAVERNAYGRQIASFETDLDFAGLESSFHAIFIRAPRIVTVGPDVEPLASLDGDAVAVRAGRVLVTVFHPELSGDDRVHAYFVDSVVPGPTRSPQLGTPPC